MMNDSILYIFDIIIVLSGIYCIYSAIYMKMTGKVHANKLVIPKDKDVNSCKDPDGYISYIVPRLIIYAILVIILGGLAVANDFLHIFSNIIAAILCFVMAAVVIGLWLVVKKTNDKYWK